NLEDDSMAARMQQQIDGLQETIEQTAEELRPQLIEQLRASRHTKQQEAIADLKANIENQRLMQKLWQDRVAAQRERIDKLGDKTVDLEFARDELARAQEVFEKIADRIVMLQTEMGAPLRASPMQRATAPAKPRELVPWKRLLPSAAVGLFLPFALAVLWEQRQRRIHDVRQMVQEVNLPVLGEITALPARMAFSGSRSEERFVRDQLTFQESIEALRVALTVSPETRDLKMFAITSAISREGKSSLASSLGASLAKATRKPTLIIDGDMRCPSLHEIFDREISPGLTDVLAGRCGASDSVVATDSPWLHFLPSGQLKFTPHALLQDGAMEAVLAELRQHYRYIVIDLPPVLAASEALVLAGAAEGTLVCAMRDISRGPQFRLACERLASSGARILGTVISGLPARTWAYKYGGYGYGWERYAQAGAAEEPAAGPPALPPPSGTIIDA
ncbi:MAG TPA: polysaccharide biosynthesis tyrosine autokinase, partial [Pirellulales bacterium]